MSRPSGTRRAVCAIMLAAVAGVHGQDTAGPMRAYRTRIVDFGGDVNGGYYRGGGQWQVVESGTVDVDGDGVATDDSTAYVPFSLTDPMNPRFPEYNDEATNARFYGAMSMRFANTKARITEGHTNVNHELRDDFNMMAHIQKPDTAFQAWGMWFWQKADFLNGGDRYRVTFDDESMIVPHISRYFCGLDDARWIVRDGNRFFISEAQFRTKEIGLEPQTGRHKSHILHPTQTRWAAYVPKEPCDIAFAAESARFAEHTFGDVTAVGFYVARDPLAQGEIWLKWHSFEAYAVVNRPGTPSFHMDMVAIQDSDGLLLGRTEVPYSLWKRVWHWAVSNQYCFDLAPGYVFDRDGDMGSMKLCDGSYTADHPATDMTWLDAVAWCNAFSEMEGKTPCYYADEARGQVLRIVKERDNPTQYGRQPRVFVKWDVDGYRLPTGAEWTQSAVADSAQPGTGHAWTHANSGGRTHAVGTLPAGRAGLHDMIGNVWEMTWDCAGDVFDPGVQLTRTVLGGGFLFADSAPAVSALPFPERPWYGSCRIGLRVCRRDGPEQTSPVAASEGTMPIWEFGTETSFPPVVSEAAKPLPDLATVTVNDGAYTRTEDEAHVTVSPFHIARTEISYATWSRAYLWGMTHGYEFDADGDMGSMDWQTGQHPHGPSEPVTDITWEDAALWCNALSEMLGRTPCYYTDGERTQICRRAHPWRVSMWQGKSYAPPEVRWKELYVRWHADGFRLPTEAEWRIACGTGNVDTASAWLADSADGTTHPVGQKNPSAFGLFDMEGNVAEMIWDWPGHDYYRSHDPKGSGRWAMFGKPLMGCHFGSVKPHRNSGPALPGEPRPWNGFRVVRCEADVHPETEVFAPKTVLDVDPVDFDPLQGRTFRANLMRTGVFDCEPVRQFGGVKWRFRTGAAVRCSPVIADGVVYVGSDDGTMYAIDLGTGKETWRFDAGKPVQSSATVVNGAVFIGNTGGTLFALDAETGEPRWTVNVPGATNVSSTAYAYGTVFAGFAGWNNRCRLTGFDAATGREQWRFRFTRLNGGPLAPALAPDMAYFAAGDIQVFGVDLQTEYPVWQQPGMPTYACMAVAGDTVYYKAKTRLRAHDRITGEQKWQFYHADNPTADRNPTSAPAVDTKRVYTGLKTGQVVALDRETGQKQWEFDTGAPVFSAPSVADNVICVGSDSAFIYALEAQTGKELWCFRTGGLVRTSPCLADGVVLFGSDDGTIYALR